MKWTCANPKCRRKFVLSTQQEARFRRGLRRFCCGNECRKAKTNLAIFQKAR